MKLWDRWKKGFDAWEVATADALEVALRSPLLLTPSGAVLTAAMKLKARRDRWTEAMWGALGLPTKRDQERTLHLLNQLERRLIDLEQKLDDRME